MECELQEQLRKKQIFFQVWKKATIFHVSSLASSQLVQTQKDYLLQIWSDVTESRLNKLSVQLSVPAENFLLRQNSQKPTIKPDIM